MIHPFHLHEVHVIPFEKAQHYDVLSGQYDPFDDLTSECLGH
jgi:hypothetical protein